MFYSEQQIAETSEKWTWANDLSQTSDWSQSNKIKLKWMVMLNPKQKSGLEQGILNHWSIAWLITFSFIQDHLFEIDNHLFYIASK
jgi:hypothetical protein